MLGMFRRTAQFVKKKYDDLAGRISAAVETYAADVRSRAFQGRSGLCAAGVDGLPGALLIPARSTIRFAPARDAWSGAALPLRHHRRSLPARSRRGISPFADARHLAKYGRLIVGAVVAEFIALAGFLFCLASERFRRGPEGRKQYERSPARHQAEPVRQRLNT